MALLHVHYAAIQRQFPGAPVLYVFDSKDADGATVPKGAQMVTSTWERGDRLSGPEAVAGILATLSVTAAATGGPVAKIDADTVLTGSAWADPLLTGQCDYIGFEGWHSMLASGALYAMTQKAAEISLKAITPWPWLTDPSRSPEDRAIYLTALRAMGPGRVRLVPWSTPGQKTHPTMGWHPAFYSAPEHVHLCTAALHCGEKPVINPLTDAGVPRHAPVLRAMRAAFKAIKTRSGV